MQKFVLNINKILPRDKKLVGGKAVSLGKMIHRGISVPSGFVVLTSAYEYFLETVDLNIEIQALLRKTNYEDISSITKSEDIISSLINGADIPEDLGLKILENFDKLKVKFVAIRSSATAEDSRVASWAGELETHLNVLKKNILRKIKECWTSLFTSRAMLYRFKKGLDKENISMAVVVQEMVQSEVSGVCFTVHPLTKDCNQMVIEAGYGLGEAIVGGKITPDTYVINKKEAKILDKNISQQNIMILKGKEGTRSFRVKASKKKKQKLSDEKIIELGRLCKKIESYYKSPQDIEWAFAQNKFYVLQSRPITTL